jgi:hypothetical protein
MASHPQTIHRSIKEYAQGNLHRKRQHHGMIIIQNLYEYLYPVTHTQTRNETSLFFTETDRFFTVSYLIFSFLLRS